MTMEMTEHGLRVRETSSGPYVAKLIKEPRSGVERVRRERYGEMRKTHELPERD